MAETEVESILREIRERVLAQQQDVAGATARSAPANGMNGGSDDRDAGSAGQMARQGDSETVATKNLALIGSYLTTTQRAWDRLPPLLSNRSGIAARLELWLKRRLRVGTRWFTWEQVNFNAAAHHALRDMLQALTAYEQELAKLRARVDTQEQTQRVATEHRINVDARLAELVKELREREERLQQEQRVCFKQLSLESSEAAVLEDRARRKTETFLEEIKRRVEQLEK